MVVVVVAGHAEDFGADQGTDFAADAGVLVNGGNARHGNLLFMGGIGDGILAV
jgi:hypothetical protein